MADEAIESTAIEGLQGSELMGRPLRINKAEPEEVLVDPGEEEEAAMAAAMVVAMAAAMVVVIMAAVAMVVVTMAAAMVVVIMAAAMVVVATVVAMAAATMAAAMVVAILNLILLTPINLLEQKVGKIEVMGILLKMLNMKVVEVGEKEEFLMVTIHQTNRISNPFL